MDFLPHACYPSRPVVSGGTGVYSSTTLKLCVRALPFAMFSCVLQSAQIKRSWKREKSERCRLSVWRFVPWDRVLELRAHILRVCLKWRLWAPERVCLTQRRGFFCSRLLQRHRGVWVCVWSGIIHSRFENRVSHYNKVEIVPLWGRHGMLQHWISSLFSLSLSWVHNPRRNIPCVRLSWF